MIFLSACVSDPAGDPLDTAAQSDDTEQAAPEDQASATPFARPQEATPAGDAADPVSAAVGCSVVTTCNAAGPDGTRCRQQGCSLGAASLECGLESFAVCGAAVCPVILIRLDGTRQNLCRN